jgi:hypothetical protein
VSASLCQCVVIGWLHIQGNWSNSFTSWILGSSYLFSASLLWYFSQTAQEIQMVSSQAWKRFKNSGWHHLKVRETLWFFHGLRSSVLRNAVNLPRWVAFFDLVSVISDTLVVSRIINTFDKRRKFMELQKFVSAVEREGSRIPRLLHLSDFRQTATDHWPVDVSWFLLPRTITFLPSCTRNRSWTLRL